MFYEDGSAILIGDRVTLGNGEAGTVVELIADVEALFSPDGPPQKATPGVLVLTDKGARIMLSDIQADDMQRLSQ